MLFRLGSAKLYQTADPCFMWEGKPLHLANHYAVYKVEIKNIVSSDKSYHKQSLDMVLIKVIKDFEKYQTLPIINKKIGEKILSKYPNLEISIIGKSKNKSWIIFFAVIHLEDHSKFVCRSIGRWLAGNIWKYKSDYLLRNSHDVREWYWLLLTAKMKDYL